MWIWLMGAAFCVGLINVYIYDGGLTLYFRENSYLFLYGLVVLVWVIGDRVIRQLDAIIERLSRITADAQWETGTGSYQPAYNHDGDPGTKGETKDSEHWFINIVYSTAIVIIIGILLALMLPEFIQG
tara:strand:+ start:65 stop:448 length:384 start_codon:yes stop_codon:yes gene_type:complete